ncbi:YrhA family protein [Hymenobacter terrenus]|uniref:YrhA family protein n=1 Tax=Hymenobacter terrenus TaxID=1629124 RepID=UPI0012E01702|nr:YrhA family protein [Hymenobacter terrenus]
MEHSTLTLLDEIRAVKEERGRPLAPPATVEELRMLQEEAAQKLDYVLPAIYLELLSYTNGIAHNGMQLYATHALTRTTPDGQTTYDRRGLVETNLLWRDTPPNQEFVFLAESGDVLYGQHIPTGQFQVVDRITNEMDDPKTGAYATLDPLLERLFHEMLNHFDILNYRSES